MVDIGLNEVRWARLPWRDGWIELAVPPTSDFLADAILRGGYETPYAFRLALDLVEPGATVLDLGAHLGTFSLLAAATGCRVLAVEAGAKNAACLRLSATRNGFDQMEIVEAAVTDGPMEVPFIEHHAWGHIAREAESEFYGAQSGAEQVRIVQGCSVDDLLASKEIHRVDLVKVDVEGAEPEAIDGMRQLLVSHDAPPVIFESNWVCLRERGLEPADVMRRFADAGFELFWIGRDELAQVDPSTFQSETVCDYLAARSASMLPRNWHLRSHRSIEELVNVIAAESRLPTVDHRRSLALALEGSESELREHAAVQRVLGHLRLDHEDRVASAASWWSQNHATPGEAPLALRRWRVAQGRLRILAEASRALAEKAERVTRNACR